MLIAHLDSIGRNAHHLTGMPRAEAYMEVCRAYSNIQTDSEMEWLAKNEKLKIFND